MTKLNIGLFCNSNIKEEYLQSITSMEQFHLSGYFGNSNQKFLDQLDIPFYNNVDLLLEQSEAIVIMMPALHQYDLAKKAIKALKHVFIEKPLTSDIDEAETLLAMQREADVKVQIGSGLRLNPSFLEANILQSKPLFVETQNFTSGADANVIFDLMLNDLDIVLQLVKSEVRKISANGVCMVNDSPDIVNARIEFGNGCVASLTSNRLSKNNIHTTSIYQKGNPIIIDFLNSNTGNQPESAYKIAVQKQATENSSSNGFDTGLSEIIKTELNSFYECIIKNSLPQVPLYDGCRTLKLAYQIIDKIEERGLEK